MTISLEQIKKLREISGAGMGDCRNALIEAAGDLDKAVDVLRKKGIAKAAKRSDREAGEGLIKIAINEAGNEGYLIDLRAETDFVVLSEQFQNFSNQVIKLAAAARPQNLEELLGLSMSGRTVKETLENLSGIVGEKMEIKRYAIVASAGSVAAYSHAGGRIGVLVAINRSGEAELAREIAMQVAAANPQYINPEDVPASALDKEKEIYREQLLAEGKPEGMLEKIMVGKLSKFYEEVCLTKQEYIKDDKKKVADILSGAVVEKFVRFNI
jgi:elongation factor Ts